MSISTVRRYTRAICFFTIHKECYDVEPDLVIAKFLVSVCRVCCVTGLHQIVFL